MKKIVIAVIAVAALVAGVAYFTGGGVSASEESSTKSASLEGGAQAWSVRCNDEAKEGTPMRGRCEIFQRLIVKETGKRFVEAAIGFPDDKNTARGIFVVPLGVLLQPGMQMKIDDGKPFKFQARYCDANGCFGYVDLNGALLDSMRKGSKVTLSFQALNGKAINVELSLKDFSAALQKVS